MSDKFHINIDCIGKYWEKYPAYDIQLDNCCYHFIFAPELKQSKQFHLALFIDYACLTRHTMMYPRGRRLALLIEPGTSPHFAANRLLANRFCQIFTHDSQLLEKYHNSILMPFGTNSYDWPDKSLHVPKKSRLVSFLGGCHLGTTSRGHSVRNDVITLLRKQESVESFGKGFNWIEDISDAIGPYAFSIAMENSQRDYYFTEKLINCLLMEAVPIYWGCHGVRSLFDERGLICFESPEELERILKSLSYSRYQSMLPFVRANKQKAIDSQWACNKDIYRRLAQSIHTQNWKLKPVVCRPRVCQWLFAATRNIRHGLAKGGGKTE